MLSSQRLCPSSCRSFVAFIAHLGFVTIRKTSRKKRNKRGFSLPTVASDSGHYRYIIQVLLQPHPTPSFSAKACSLPVRIRCPRIFLSTQSLTNEKRSQESPTVK